MVKTAIAALSELSLFPILTESTRPYDPKLPVKNWADPNPVVIDLGGLGVALYSTYKVDPAGKVVKSQFALPVGQAAVENLPPKNWTGAAVRFTPIACRDLETGESFRVDFGGGIEVLNDALYAALMASSPTSAAGFTDQDRKTLNGLAPLLAGGGLGAPVDNSAQLNRMEQMLNEIQLKLNISHS